MTLQNPRGPNYPRGADCPKGPKAAVGAEAARNRAHKLLRPRTA